MLITLPIAAALGLRITRLLQTPNLHSSDPATRALFAEKLSAFGWGEVYASTIWPPAHFWLMNWGQWLGSSDPQLGARSIAVLLGSLACWPAFLIARRSALLLWPDAKLAASCCAVLSGWLVAIEPLGLRYSSLTYAEVPCTLFVLTACAALLPDERGRPARWWLALPSLALACGLRYEAWLLAPLMLLCGQFALRERVALTLATVAPASLWFIDRPRYLALNSVTRDKMSDILPQLAPERLDAAGGVWVSLLNNGLPAVLPLATIGLIILFRHRGTWVLPAATLGAISFPPISAMLGHIPLYDRYLQPPITLLAVAAALGAVACAQWAQSSARGHSWLSRLTFALLAAALLLPLLPRSAAELSDIRDKGDVPLSATGQNKDHSPAKKTADLAAQGTWEELDETALLLREIAEQWPDRLIYIEPNLRTASYMYWRASIPADRVAGFYQWTRDDVRWREDVNKVLLGWKEAIYVLVRHGGEASETLGLPEADVPCLRLQQHQAGRSMLRCLQETRGYRIFAVSPLPAPNAREQHQVEPELHQEKDSPKSKESDAAPGPT